MMDIELQIISYVNYVVFSKKYIGVSACGWIKIASGDSFIRFSIQYKTILIKIEVIIKFVQDLNIDHIRLLLLKLLLSSFSTTLTTYFRIFL